MRLILVRHAQSANNKLTTSTGSEVGRVADPSLTELGFTQAEMLGQWWERLQYPKPQAIYSSLMRRTIETIDPLAEFLDLAIVARTDSFEIGGPYEGAWADQTAAPGSPRSLLEGLSERVVLPASATEDGWWSGPVESEQQTRDRAAALWAALREQHADDCIVVCSHGIFGSLLLGAALGTRWRMHMNNTGTASLSDGKWGPQLDWFNRLDHLRNDQHTN